MKKVLFPLLAIVLALSVVFAAGVAATPGPGPPNKVDAKGAVTDIWFVGAMVPTNVFEGPTVNPGVLPYPTGKWHVKLDMMTGKLDAKFDVQTSIGKVKIKSVTGTGTWSYGSGGMLIVSGVRCTITTDGPLPGKSDTYVGVDLGADIKVDTNIGQMTVGTTIWGSGKPTWCCNLYGNVKDIKLKY